MGAGAAGGGGGTLAGEVAVTLVLPFGRIDGGAEVGGGGVVGIGEPDASSFTRANGVLLSPGRVIWQGPACMLDN
jgi:hypothetical protein